VNIKKIILFILTLGIIIITVLFYVKITSEQEKIKRTLKNGEKAFARKDVKSCLELISENYRDVSGFTKIEIEKSLNDILPQLQEIKITMKNLKVNVEGDKAKVTLALQVFAKFNGVPTMLVGTPNEPKNVVIFIKKEKNIWRIIRVGGIEDKETVNNNQWYLQGWLQYLRDGRKGIKEIINE